MKHVWNNVVGQYKVGIYFDPKDSTVREAKQDRPLPPLAGAIIPNDPTLVVEFVSSGWCDPGSMYGGWQNVGNPPDGDDERQFNRVYLLDGEQEIELSEKTQLALFELFLDEVNNVELDLFDY